MVSYLMQPLQWAIIPHSKCHFDDAKELTNIEPFPIKCSMFEVCDNSAKELGASKTPTWCLQWFLVHFGAARDVTHLNEHERACTLHGQTLKPLSSKLYGSGFVTFARTFLLQRVSAASAVRRALSIGFSVGGVIFALVQRPADIRTPLLGQLRAAV